MCVVRARLARHWAARADRAVVAHRARPTGRIQARIRSISAQRAVEARIAQIPRGMQPNAVTEVPRIARCAVLNTAQLRCRPVSSDWARFSGTGGVNTVRPTGARKRRCTRKRAERSGRANGALVLRLLAALAVVCPSRTRCLFGPRGAGLAVVTRVAQPVHRGQPPAAKVACFASKTVALRGLPRDRIVRPWHTGVRTCRCRRAIIAYRTRVVP